MPSPQQPLVVSNPLCQRKRCRSDPEARWVWTNPPTISARIGAQGNTRFRLCDSVMLGHAYAKGAIDDVQVRMAALGEGAIAMDWCRVGILAGDLVCGLR